jgi:hypothetical protein
LSSLIFSGLKNGTFAPYLRLIFPIFEQLVDTKTSDTIVAASACSILQEINGFPDRLLIFFSGNPLDPARAGIKAIVFKISHSFLNNWSNERAS